MSELQASVCSDCRKRNIRCDGARPYCGACAADILACTYEQAKPRIHTLPRGSACLPCRQAKIRCDAKKPECSPCQKSPSRGPCLYDRPSRRTANARIAKKLNSADTFGAAVNQSSGHTASLENEFDFSTFPVSDVSQNHRNMVFRLVSLSHDLVYGNLHTSAEAQAIMLGDISGTTVSPFFVYYAELSGRHQKQLSEMLWGSQGALAQLTFRFLSLIRSEDDPLIYARAHWMIALASMTIGNPTLAWKHYRRAIAVIRKHHIRFASTVVTNYPGPFSVATGFIPSEEDHQRVAFLSKILYLEAFLSFYVSGLPGTKVWANRDQEDRLPGCANGIRQDLGDLCDELGRQFRIDLPVAYPSIWETCPLILRTKTFLWLKDVKMCLEEPPVNSVRNDSTTRNELMARGNDCLQHMVGLASKYSDVGDRDRCMILRSNTLLTIAGLLELHRPVFEDSTVATEDLLGSRRKCKELLIHLANTARQTMEEDGRRIEDFITHDHGRDQGPYESQTVVCLVSTGGFAGTLLPLPSYEIGTVDERTVENFIRSPLQKVIEVNFNLASKNLWGKFMDANTRAAKLSTNYLLEDILE